MKVHVMLSREAEAIVAAVGCRRRGIVRTDLAAGLGVAGDDLDRLRERGVLVALGRGVDRLRDRPFDWQSQCQAALDLAGPDAALGLRSAARLLGWYAYRSCDAVEVVVTRGRDQRTTVGRIVQTRRLPADHLTVVDGFRVTTAARTFFDLCGDPDPGVRYRSGYHESRMALVYNDAVARRGLTFVQEAAVVAVTARRGLQGSRLARSILVSFGAEHEPTRSDTESLFFLLVRSRGLPEPERQAVLADERGFIGAVDFLWRRSRHVVEVDSSWHDGPLDRAEDARRDERLRAAGYTVARYRYGQIVGRPDLVAGEVGVATRCDAE